MPAPQALNHFTRPEMMAPFISGRVVSSHSGNSRQWLNRIASILHSFSDGLKAYEVRVVDVAFDPKEVEVRAAGWPWGPLTWLALLGAALAAALVGVSIWLDDGMSLIATLCLSLLSSLIGVGSKWALRLPQRRAAREVPRSDVVIKYPNGSFVIVRANEETQRQLYWHPESCEYLVGEQVYRGLALVGTLLLMAGVVFLANADIRLQIQWAGSYVLLNAAYWVVAALPARLHWDLSAFKATERPISRGTPNDKEESTFTLAMWRAIAVTRSSAWARDFDIAPKSKVWDAWLDEAGREAETWGERIAKDETLILPNNWDPNLRLSELMKRETERERAEKQA